MMKNKRLLVVSSGIAVSLFLGGCTSFNEVSGYTPAKTYDESHKKGLDAIYKKLDSDLQKSDEWANQLAHGFMTQDEVNTLWEHSEVAFDSSIQYTQGGESAYIDFSVYTSPKYMFGPGKYVIDNNTEMGKILLTWLSGNIKKIVDTLTTHGLDRYSLSAVVQGRADGLPIGSGNVTYNGIFGDEINMPASITKLNNRPTDFSIWKGKELLNQELAAVRAAGLAAMITKMSKPAKPAISYQIETTEEIGSEQRFARVHLQITE